MHAGTFIRRCGLGASAVTLLALTSTAYGDPLSPEELEVVDRRLTPVVPSAAKITIEEGSTILLERTVIVKGSRLRGVATDYEGLVTGVTSPDGVVVHPRADRFDIVPDGGQTKVRFVYAIHIEPGPATGGRVQLTLSLVQRRGLANVVMKQKVTHWVKVSRTKPSDRDLAADFWGYRYYAEQTAGGRQSLARQRLRLSLKDLSRLPPLNRADARTTGRVYRFVQDRRRMWIAHRHLVTASRSPDRDTSAAGRAYLAALATPKDQLRGLPDVALVESSRPPPREAPVEMLEPTESIPVAPPSGTGGGELSPLSSYDPSSEREPSTELPPSRRPREATEPDEIDPSQASLSDPTAAPPPGPVAGAAADEEFVRRTDDLLGERVVRRYKRIPSYNRGLVLDDPNIAYGGAIRFAWASVKVREQAVAAALFFEGQVAFTPYLGVELTVPTEYVNVDVDRAKSVYAMGNPLLAVKWRLFLPKVLERQPALTLRTRVGIPIAPLHSVPPTSLGAEDFSREAHFADTYAFFLEKTDIGVGASLAWQWNLLYLGAQFYADYFIPVSDALDQSKFLTLSYGASVGVLPFGDIVGFYGEARATSLFAGPGRTEFFTYFGARGRFLDHIEPALWIALPLGSVRNANTFQIGAELRFSYDVYDVVDRGGRSRDVPLID